MMALLESIKILLKGSFFVFKDPERIMNQRKMFIENLFRKILSKPNVTVIPNDLLTISNFLTHFSIFPVRYCH